MENSSVFATLLQAETTAPIPANTLDDTVFTDEFYEDFSYIMNVIATPVVCGLGLIVNCLGIWALLRASRQEKLAIYVYLCSLTTLDSIFLLVGLIRVIPNFVRIYDKYLSNMLEEYGNLGFVYADMVLTYSTTSLIVIMAVERLMALVRPFSVKDSVLIKHPKKIVVSCFVLNALFLSMYPIHFEVASLTNFENRTEFYLRFKLYAVEYMETYEIVHTFVHNYIPACILLVVNILIPISFARIMRRRSALSKTTSAQNKQTKITFAVLGITIFYLLFSFPDSFIKTRAYFDKDYSFSGKYRLSFWMMVDISNMFSYLNAANDFIIYILVSDHYRRIFRDLYCVWFDKKRRCFSARRKSSRNETRSTIVRESPSDLGKKKPCLAQTSPEKY